MKKFLIIISLLLGIIFIGNSPSTFAHEKPRGLIQMAILLDTSNSMDGLINQAKSQIWKIVNELATAKQDRMFPRLEVALYEYGNNRIAANHGYIRMIVPLSTDLDDISEKLFGLSTNGGSEYCGQVIFSAVNGLEWSRNDRTYKVIVIAGNEPFTQGDINYRYACKTAFQKGIVVNTIFCGSYREGIETNWKDGAAITDGVYLNIDQDQVIPVIDAPQDEEITRLGQALNLTYIPYGQEGDKKQQRQLKEDKNAGTINSETYVERSLAKASSLYDNTSWDLVDAVKKEGFKVLDTLKGSDLSPEMQKMTPAERKKYVETKMAEREKIQKRMNELNLERQVYVEQEMKKQSTQKRFDTAIIMAIRQQAAKKNFQFK